PPAACLPPGRRARGERRRRQIDEAHARALGGEARRGGAADASAPARDEHDFPGKARRHRAVHLALGADSTQAWSAMTEAEGLKALIGPDDGADERAEAELWAMWHRSGNPAVDAL